MSAKQPLAVPLLPATPKQGASVTVHAPGNAEDRSVLSKASLGTFGKQDLRDALSRHVHAVSVIVNIIF